MSDKIPQELRALLPTFVRLAQKTYDDWSQDPETDDLNGGGICHLIADELVGAMGDRGIVCTSVSAHIGEVHVYSVARLASGVWLVDIEPSVYERGSAYTWTKIPDVNFEESDITIELLDSDPKNFREYVEEDWEEDDYEPNVRKKAWVEQLLTKRDKIEKFLGLPLGTMLGCGHWGCVFESTPPWVVKLSIDPTEGPIWSKIMGLVNEEHYGALGFPEIRSLRRITPDITYGGRKKKVWAIVREGIEPVYKSTPANISLGGRKGEFTKSFFQRAAGNEADFDRCTSSLFKYQMLARAWHSFTGRFDSAAHRQAVTGYASREEVEEKIQRVTDTGFNGAAFAPLGESLSMLASNGVYLRDVHLLNIGWHVARDADDWDRIVVFDPGHTPTAGGKDIEEALIENRLVYHGSPELFEMGHAKPGTGMYGPGLYFTTDFSEAQAHALKWRPDSKPTVYPCDVILKNPLHYYDLFPEETGRHDPPPMSEEQTRLRRLVRSSDLEPLMALGYDGIIVDFSKQNPRERHSYYIVFDTSGLVCERNVLLRR